MEAIAIFGFIGIVYGALCAMAQKDFKKLVAYSSVSHMGYVLLGLAAMTTIGITGAVFQMFNHGTITSMLFLLVGVVYDRVHDRTIDKFGGLANIMPGYFFIVVIAFFAALGLPGLSGWWSESFVFIGAFRNDDHPPLDDTLARRRRARRGIHALAAAARIPRNVEDARMGASSPRSDQARVADAGAARGDRRSSWASGPRRC